MSWTEQAHKRLDQKSKRSREIIQDGKIFYDVFIIAIARAWKDRTLRIRQEPNEFIEAVAVEMGKLFAEPCDYEQTRLDETGIELEVV